MVCGRRNFGHSLASSLAVAVALGGGLALVRDTPSRCVLSLCEVSLNLLQWFLSCC